MRAAVRSRPLAFMLFGEHVLTWQFAVGMTFGGTFMWWLDRIVLPDVAREWREIRLRLPRLLRRRLDAQ